MRSNNVIGYITEGFPGVMTFLEREISGLIQHGWEVSVFALHKESACLLYTSDAADE